MATPRYSVIVPVYNRPFEVKELLESLSKQSFKDFEVIIIEDGSTQDCKQEVDSFQSSLNISYTFKPNSGPGDSRNFGMKLAKGDFLVFFDSDCIVPSQYFEEVQNFLSKYALDAFGGPDKADNSFSDIQKAIDYAMTSLITTGGIRGKENKLDNYQPRSFNMGISKDVYKKVGGFGDIHPGEDPDLSYRIQNAGFEVGLIPNAFVYHKRRVDFGKFQKQVSKFGVVRPILMKWYPSKTKFTYFLPTFFLFSVFFAIVLSFWNIAFLFPIGILAGVLFIDALMRTNKIKIALMAVLASFIQLLGYGYGFLRSFIRIHILRQNEREAFPDFFFKK